MRDHQSGHLALSRRHTLGLLVGGLATAATARAATPKAWAAVDQLGAATLADHLEPGFSLSVMKNGAFVYSKGFGFANLETRTPVSPTSVFRIGSVNKQFTAAALALLAEEGKLSFDDALAKYLPEFPRAADVTLRQMLNHTSGIGNYTNRVNPQDMLRAMRADYNSAELLKAMIEHTSPTFVFEPGTDWAYSNTAYVLLGLVIEKITGEAYAAHVKRRLFEPAGLTRTSVDSAAEIVPDRVSGYTSHPGSATEFDNAAYISMTYPGAAGAMRSTSEDLCRWHLALFGGKIIKPTSLEEMLKPGLLKNGQLPEVSRGPGPKKPLKYGFGLGISELDGRKMIAHSGGIPGFASLLTTLPDDHITVATIANTDDVMRGNFMARQQAVVDAAIRAALA
ncbi:serine hydrolase [Novosphingobium sp. FKTRR1]|uniref:serine hydrolase domain-containing protein n=1 Tax=Novosphingobium sp. FKTRR1 TaxID=2879118 RepID=UPI001CF09163|nr:serine hydrolase domain-containing protein [Novosphingobium sp. FKTRR1]